MTTLRKTPLERTSRCLVTELDEAIEEVLEDEYIIYKTGELRVNDNLIREILEVGRAAVLPNIIRYLRDDHRRLLELYLTSVMPEPVIDCGMTKIFVELAMKTNPRSMKDACRALEVVVNNPDYRPLFARCIEPEIPPQSWWKRLIRL